MSLVPRHQVIGASGIDAFQEYVVVRVRRHLEPLRRSHAITAALDELEEDDEARVPLAGFCLSG